MESDSSSIESDIEERTAFDILGALFGDERLTLGLLNEKLFPDGGPKPGSLIEISGPSNAGKSLLLWQLMSWCITPTKYGGKNCSIVYINLNRKINTRSFVRHIKNFVVHNGGEKLTQNELELLVLKCLDSVITFKCDTPDDLEIVLLKLDNILLLNTQVALIAIDDFCTFYWQTVEELEEERTKYVYYTTLLSRFKEIAITHKICCAYTIDTEYLLPKYEVRQDIEAVPKADYAFRMQVDAEGKITLNDNSISIDGIGFVL